MKVKYSAILLLFLVSLVGFNKLPTEHPQQQWKLFSQNKYKSLQETTLSYRAFEEGLKGYFNLLHQGFINNKKFLTIVDFGLPSSEKRMFIIDIINFKIVHKTYCSHGRNSGGLTATNFSNKEGSYQSSLSFYITEHTYSGKFDLALRLEGLESFNNLAKKRAIVMHGADYATEAFLKKNNNVLGRSLGCPAVPKDEAKDIINWIKNGSCLYIYHPTHAYRKLSRLLLREYFLANKEITATLFSDRT